jgi:hypothetical protein
MVAATARIKMAITSYRIFSEAISLLCKTINRASAVIAINKTHSSMKENL